MTPLEFATNSKYYSHITSGNNVGFCFSTGRKYVVNPVKKYWDGTTSEYTCCENGTIITLSNCGVKFPIGSKRYYNTLDEAKFVAELWRKLVDNSSTHWKWFFHEIIVRDTTTNKIVYSI